MSRDERGDAWARFRDVVVFLFTIGTGASGLGGWTAGAAQLTLRLVAALSALYLIFLLLRYYRVARERDAVSGQDYARDIEDVVTRRAASNDEIVQVVIKVGSSDEEDRIEEEVRVEPHPQMVDRLIRPIMPDHRRMARSLREIEFSCAVDESDDGPVLVSARPIRTREYLQIWLIFNPTVTKPTTWRFRYRPRGLWRQLRETGRDRLIWHDTMPSDGRSPLVELRIRFIFAESGFKYGVKEHNGYGTVGTPERLDTGEWVVDWCDPSPAGRRYEWTITRAPMDGHS